MIEMSNITLNAIHVIAEPGDMTRYDFFMIPQGGRYYFYSIANNFRYPRCIDGYEVPEHLLDREDIDDTILNIAEKENCNPNTVLACLNAMYARSQDE